MKTTDQHPDRGPQLEVLRPYVTAKIKAIVRRRLFEGMKFFEGHTFKSQYTRGEVKLALIISRIGNPEEPFSADELALINGIQRKGESR